MRKIKLKEVPLFFLMDFCILLKDILPNRNVKYFIRNRKLIWACLKKNTILNFSECPELSYWIVTVKYTWITLLDEKIFEPEQVLLLSDSLGISCLFYHHYGDFHYYDYSS